MRLVAVLCFLMSGLVVALAVETTRGAEEQASRRQGSRAKQTANAEAQPEILELRLKESPKPNYGKPVPSQISGRVVLLPPGNSPGAEGVSVTDGFSVVKTDASGAYALKPDPRAVFVYITRPSGYDVQGDWYKSLSDEVDFTIKPATRDEDEYIFVHVTDTHVSQNRRSLVGLSRFVNEINALTPLPRFVVNSGDLLNLHKALVSSPDAGRADFRNYVGIMNHLTISHYNVAGDHTDSSYRLDEFPRGHLHCGKPLYWEHLGPHFFSFEYGKIHFASVDFGYHLGQRQILVNGESLEYPTLEVQSVHVEWLKQDMARRTPETFVVTTAEHDLTKFCPGFLEMARQHDVRLQLVGDTHVVSHKARPVPYRSGGALAGCWWNPKANQLCPDLSPQGYLIYRVKGERLDYFYKGLGRRVEIVSHRMGAAWQGRVEVQAHLVQPEPDEALEYTLNGKDWHAMREIGRPFYRVLYSAEIDSTNLPDGLLKFAVRSTGGEVRSREFVITNGADSLRFKADATLAFSVGAATSWTTSRAPADKVDVLFNGKVVGLLEPEVSRDYLFNIPASILQNANTLSFRFVQSGDGLNLSGPLLSLGENSFRDLRDAAIRQVKIAHWGNDASDWGGFVVGNAEPPDETPFHRKQNVFCFVLRPAE
ncbi:MAG: calcineurin-like phosphoesterase C-terminal domain-containing protein [Planctomycetes bacterium]|nr:calcineurin-like phosphoesterase C-terminal domain-containing protein [Planctomycetota bacterium]